MQQNSPARAAYIDLLKQADRGDYTPLIDFIKADELAIVKALIRMGKKVNETENNGYHPLHVAIRKGLDAIALVLIEENADIQFRDRSSFDPFELAISLGNLRIVCALHKAGYPYLKYNPCPPKLLAYSATLDEFKMMLE